MLIPTDGRLSTRCERLGTANSNIERRGFRVQEIGRKANVVAVTAITASFPRA